jgi:hypothetical protein
MPNLFSAARVEPRNGSETTEVLRAFRNGDRPEQRSGQYLFPERGVTWVPDDLAAPATSIVYYTDPSHLEILRRQLGEARFREVMRSMDPEKAAREALEEQRLRIRNLEPHEFSEMIQRLHSTITAIPLDMKIPSEIMGLVLELLRKIGLYGSDINEYFALNRVRFPELGQSEVQITGIGVEVITGNVMRWRSGESGETTSILLMLRENMNAVMMDLPLDPFTGITFHIDFVSYLQRIFGEDRIVYRYEPRPLTSQYRQVWRDPGSGQDREIIHYPLRIRVLPDGTYRIFNSYSGRGETSGNWQMP